MHFRSNQFPNEEEEKKILTGKTPSRKEWIWFKIW